MVEFVIPSQVKYRLRRELRKHGKQEIGGLLMGEQLSSTCFRMMDFSVSVGNEVSFNRNFSDHRAKLDLFFERTNHNYRQFNYLGEWHSHPKFSVEPSSQDLQTMQSLVHEETSIGFAFLLILRLDWKFFLAQSCHIFVEDKRPEMARVNYANSGSKK